MSRRVALSLVILLLASPLKADETTSLHLDLRERVLLATTAEWQAHRLLKDHRVGIEFLEKDSKRIKVFQSEVESDLLISSEVRAFNGKSYLITRWSAGNMSTVLRIFDPLSEKKVLTFERYSLGQLKYNVTKSGLEITINEPRAADPLPKTVTSTWKAGGS